MAARETITEVYATAQMIAQEAFAEAVEQYGGGILELTGNVVGVSDMDKVVDRARDLIWESVDGTQDVIYYSRAGAVVAAFNELDSPVMLGAEDSLSDMGQEYSSYDEHVVALSFFIHLDLANEALYSMEAAA